MVPAAPNRTVLVARVTGQRPHATVAKWDVLALEVLASEPVERYHDMIRAQPGQQVEVAVDREWLPAGRHLAGTTVRLVATVAGPEVLQVAYGEPAVTVVRE
jgi:hypothetical protein